MSYNILQTDKKATRFHDKKTLTPSSMSSSQWSQVSADLRAKSFFSARVNNAKILGEMKSKIGEALDVARRNPNKAYQSRDKFVSEMKDFLGSRGYALGGSKLTDITSNKRLSLIYNMNVNSAREYAKYVRGQDPDILDEFPAWEFKRVEKRATERSGWQDRFKSAGGTIYNGRMFALKNSDVWVNLSEFGRPYPPFDYGSGMGVRDIDRETAIKVGLLPADEPVDELPDFDVILEADTSVNNISKQLQQRIIKETPNAKFIDGKIELKIREPLPTWKDEGLENAKNWQQHSFEIISLKDAKNRLNKTESFVNPIGDEIVFSEEIHWIKNPTEKPMSDVNGRLRRLPLAEKAVYQAEEIWQTGEYKNHLIAYGDF